MAGNAGLGRPKGSRNKATQELMALVAQGESPIAYAVGVMRNTHFNVTCRLQAAKLVAAYVQPRPAPAAESVELELPEVDTATGVTRAVAEVLRAVASGEVSADAGRDLVAILDVQRKSLEAADFDRRLRQLENAKADKPDA
jgi:hypothetical protein